MAVEQSRTPTLDSVRQLNIDPVSLSLAINKPYIVQCTEAIQIFLLKMKIGLPPPAVLK